MRMRSHVWQVVGAMVVVACNDAPPSAESDAHASDDLAPYVTEAMARTLGDGEAIVQGAPIGESGLLSRERAVALAEAILPSARGIKGALRRDREGEPVAFDRLARCGSVYMASAGLETPTGAPRHVANRLGPHWFVTFCADGEAQLSISVAARATDLTIDQHGTVIFPQRSGGEFWFRGLPRSTAGGLPIPPDMAVKMAAEATGQRVAGPVQLVMAGPGWIPQAAQWRVSLSDTPIGDRLSGSVSAKAFREVYVGLRLDGVQARGKRTLAVQVPARPTAPASPLTSTSLTQPIPAFTVVEGGRP